MNTHQGVYPWHRRTFVQVVRIQAQRSSGLSQSIDEKDIIHRFSYCFIIRRQAAALIANPPPSIRSKAGGEQGLSQGGRVAVTLSAFLLAAWQYSGARLSDSGASRPIRLTSTGDISAARAGVLENTLDF